MTTLLGLLHSPKHIILVKKLTLVVEQHVCLHSASYFRIAGWDGTETG